MSRQASQDFAIRMFHVHIPVNRFPEDFFAIRFLPPRISFFQDWFQSAVVEGRLAHLLLLINKRSELMMFWGLMHTSLGSIHVSNMTTGIRPYKYCLSLSFFTFYFSFVDALFSRSFDHFLCLINFTFTIVLSLFSSFDSNIEIDILDKNTPESYKARDTQKPGQPRPDKKKKKEKETTKKGGKQKWEGTEWRFSVLSLVITVLFKFLCISALFVFACMCFLCFIIVTGFERFLAIDFSLIWFWFFGFLNDALFFSACACSSWLGLHRWRLFNFRDDDLWLMRWEWDMNDYSVLNTSFLPYICLFDDWNFVNQFNGLVPLSMVSVL